MGVKLLSLLLPKGRTSIERFESKVLRRIFGSNTKLQKMVK
jgi:hypothetical protein